MRVPLVYLPCCPVPNCLGKQGELSENSLPNLKNSSFCLPVVKQSSRCIQTPAPRHRWRYIWCTWDWDCTCWALGRTPLIISHCLGKSRYKCSEEMEGFSVLRKRKDSHPLASLSHHMIWLTYESHDIRVTVWIFNSVLKGRSKYNETLREKLEKAKEAVVIFLSFICGVSTRKCSRALSPSPIPNLTLEQSWHFYLRLTINDQELQWTNLNHDRFIWIT